MYTHVLTHQHRPFLCLNSNQQKLMENSERIQTLRKLRITQPIHRQCDDFGSSYHPCGCADKNRSAFLLHDFCSLRYFIFIFYFVFAIVLCLSNRTYMFVAPNIKNIKMTLSTARFRMNRNYHKMS